MIRQSNLQMPFLEKGLSGILVTAAVLAGLCSLTTDAFAASTRVKLACANDYYAHCSKFAPDTPEVRDCMRAVGEGLSPRCVNALVADGEVSKAEVEEHVANKKDDDDE